MFPLAFELIVFGSKITVAAPARYNRCSPEVSFAVRGSTRRLGSERLTSGILHYLVFGRFSGKQFLCAGASLWMLFWLFGAGLDIAVDAPA